MAIERFANLAATLLDGNYTSGSGTLQVDSTGSPFPNSGNFRVTIADPTTFAVKVILKVTAITDGTHFAVTAEGADANGADNDLCILTLTNGGISAMFADAVQFGAFASLPATTNQRQGNRYLCTDSPLEFYFDGSIWQARLAGRNLTVLADSGFAWINQGGASVSATNGGIKLIAPAGAGNNLRIYKKSAPATPYTLTLLMSYEGHNQDFNNAGLILRESATGKVACISAVHYTTAQISAQRFGSPTGAATQINTKNMVCRHHPYMYVRFVVDGTNVKYHVSVDGGITYYEMATELKTVSFTTAPDEYGIYAEANSGTYASALTAWELKVT